MYTLKSLITSATFITVAALAFGAHAQPAQVAAQSGPPTPALGGAVAAALMTEGEVRKIDKDNQKITLKHAEIKNLQMPGMTMVFRLKDAAMLDKVQVGSKVLFAAENTSGAFTVTALEPVK